MQINYTNIFLFVIYIPPSLGTNYYSQFFETFETLHYLNDNDVYFIGDFNIPNYREFIVHNNNVERTAALMSFLNYFDLKQCNSILNSNNRLLDLVISNVTCGVEKAQDVLLKEDSHHPALSIIIHLSVNDNTKNRKSFANNIPTYNFHKADFYSSQIQSIDWSALKNTNDVNSACERFYEMLYDLFDSYVPKTIARPRKYPVWYNNVIVQSIKEKARQFKKYKRTGDIVA